MTSAEDPDAPGDDPDALPSEDDPGTFLAADGQDAPPAVSSSGQVSSESDRPGVVDLPKERRPSEDQGEVEHIASLVFARIENKLEQHLHTQMEMPSADQAAELRAQAPEVYDAWIAIARQKADTEAYIQRAQYEVPERLARSGRPWALGALVIVLGFCGYVASLSETGIYIAGIIAALDLATMLGLFFGFRPGASPQSRSRKKELPSSDSSGDHDRLLF